MLDHQWDWCHAFLFLLVVYCFWLLANLAGIHHSESTILTRRPTASLNTNILTRNLLFSTGTSTFSTGTLLFNKMRHYFCCACLLFLVDPRVTSPRVATDGNVRDISEERRDDCKEEWDDSKKVRDDSKEVWDFLEDSKGVLDSKDLRDDSKEVRDDSKFALDVRDSEAGWCWFKVFDWLLIVSYSPVICN